MRYVLLKTYPGGPPLGTIVEEKSVKKFTLIDSEETIDFDPKQHSEFWIPYPCVPEYQIMSICSDVGFISTDPEDIDSFIKKTGMSLYKIHSVKRLSDNEIFIVKNLVIDLDNTASIHNIINMYVRDGELIINTGKTEASINHFKLFKENTFKTEDNAYLNEDMGLITLYEVNYNFEINKKSLSVTSLNNKNCKYFLYRSEAAQYVILNKPCISLLEIKNSKSLEDLIKLVKNNIRV